MWGSQFSNMNSMDLGRAARKLEQEQKARLAKQKARLTKEREQDSKLQAQLQAREEEQRHRRLRELEAQEAVSFNCVQLVSPTGLWKGS